MFRNIIAEINFKPLLDLKMLDWPLQILVSLRGPIGYLPQVTTAYRLHDAGIWTRTDALFKCESTLQVIKAVMQFLPQQLDSVVRWQLVKHYHSAAVELLQRGQRRSARQYLFKSFTSIPIRNLFDFRFYVKRNAVLMIKSFRPSLSAKVGLSLK